MREEDLSEESLEKELEAHSAVWERFGRVLSEAHNQVYASPPTVSSAPDRTVRLRYAVGSVSAAVLLAALVGVGRFPGEEAERAGEAFVGASMEEDAELDWDAGENDLEHFESFLALTLTDDSSLDIEIAVLGDSLGKWAGESSEERF